MDFDEISEGRIQGWYNLLEASIRMLQFDGLSHHGKVYLNHFPYTGLVLPISVKKRRVINA